MQSGLTYYKLDTNLYGGDTTKGCSLTGGEIDNNFNFLRGMDIVGGCCDETGLYLKNAGDDRIYIPFDGLSLSGASFDFSGSSYDAGNGILDLYVNGEYFPISGFSVCDCEKLLEQISAFTYNFECYTGETQEQIENILESLERYESSLSAMTSGETLTSKDILAHINEIDTQLSENKKNISKNENNINSINNSINNINETLSDHTQSIKALQDNKQDIANIEDYIKKVSDGLNGEIERATTAENEISTDLVKQTERIDEIYGNVNNILGAAKDTIEHYKITGITLDKTDKLNLYFGNSIDESEGHHLEVSLAKYNIDGDDKTISRKDNENGKGTLSVIFGENGVVSYEEFKQHKIAYDELLAKYKSLKAELNELKNEAIYYAGTFTENSFVPKSVLQHKYRVDIYQNHFLFEKSVGDLIQFAIPESAQVESVWTGDGDINSPNILDQFSIHHNINDIKGNSYTVYALQAGVPSSIGTTYNVKLKD